MKKFLFAFLLGLFACDAFAADKVVLCCDNGCSASSTFQCMTECADCYGSNIDPIQPGITLCDGPSGCTESNVATSYPAYTWSSASNCCVTKSCVTSDDCNLIKKIADTRGNGLYSLTYDNYCNMVTLKCKSGAKTWYACGGGYHANGQTVTADTVCTACPANSSMYNGTPMSDAPVGLVVRTPTSGNLLIRSESLPGAADVTDCYIMPTGYYTDENGDAYYIDGKCNFAESAS